VWPKRALKYIDEEHGQIDMMIQFQCMCADCLFTDYIHMPFSLRRLKRAWRNWQTRLAGKAWNVLYLENHDHPRIIQRYGSDQYWKESGKMLAVSYLFQQGTPFVYQGQELGMLNWYPTDPNLYEDVQTRWQFEHVGTNRPMEKRLQRVWHGSRDSARTPVQWSNEPNAGFTSGIPWFHVNPNYTEINAAQQEQDLDSILNFYRKAIALRKSLSAVRYGTYREFQKTSPNLYVYTREWEGERLLIICSFADKNIPFTAPKGFDLNAGEMLLSNYEQTPSDGRRFTARPYECRVYKW